MPPTGEPPVFERDLPPCVRNDEAALRASLSLALSSCSALHLALTVISSALRAATFSRKRTFSNDSEILLEEMFETTVSETFCSIRTEVTGELGDPAAEILVEEEEE